MFVEVVADLSGNYVRGLRFSYVHLISAGFPIALKSSINLNDNSIIQNSLIGNPKHNDSFG